MGAEMNEREALKLALELLESAHVATDLVWKRHDVVEAIKEALAQPEQKPVAWLGLDLDNIAEAFYRVIEEHHSRKNPFHDPVNRDAMIALRELRGLIAYMKRNTTPPRREWVGLTEEERDHFEGLHLYAARNQVEAWIEGVPAFIDAIEAKLREKNTYTSPPQRKPLPPQSPCEMTQAEGKMFKLGWLECEAAHGIKGE